MKRARLSRPVAVAAASACAAAGLIVLAPGASADVSDVVINEFYGRGGSTNQPYSHKFVELYNPTSADIPLAGTSLQYRSASGTGNASGVAALSGSVKAGGYFLVQLNSNGSTGSPLPSPDATTGLAPSGTTGTIFLADSTVAVDPANAAAVIDKLGYGGSNSPEGAAAAYTGTNATPGSLNRTNFVDTDDNAADFTFSTVVTPQNSGSDQGDGEPEITVATIAEIQGTGATSALVGKLVTTTGVVTATYPTGGFNGFYLQTPGTGGPTDSTPGVSDGLFVFGSTNVALGQCYTVTGTVTEFGGTRPEQKLTELTNVAITPVAGCAPVTATRLATLPATDADKEAHEGMLVLPEGPFTITNNYQLNQFGQLGLTPGLAPLFQATDVVEPGPDALAYEAANVARYITLDDGSSWDYLRNDTAKDSPLPYLSADEPMRTASQVTFAKPVILDYRFQWNFQPTGHVVGATDADDPLISENDREVAVPAVGGNLQLAAFNVLNYFDDLGQDEEGCDYFADRDGNPVATDFCEVRGAWSADAFADQKAKIVAAINGMDAEVVALMEIENSAGISYLPGQPRDKALADLVAALNADAGRVRWAHAPSPVVTPTNEDVIRTAFIYDPDAVQLLGPSLIDLDDAFADARYPLAQKFKATRTGKPFVAIANHFKSKGSGADDGTGQGLANPSREAQATQLTAWAEEMFGDEAVFLVGDFNAYSRETPIQIIEAAGYTNTAKASEPASATYQFSGRLGSLDHIFANEQAMRLVTRAAVWDINADEPIAFQYSRRNYNVVDFHRDDAFASSDHDAVVVGLDTGNRGRAGS